MPLRRRRSHRRQRVPLTPTCLRNEHQISSAVMRRVERGLDLEQTRLEV